MHWCARWSLQLLVVFVVTMSVTALGIDNGVNDASLRCTPTHVELHAALQRPLVSPARVYVKGYTSGQLARNCGMVFFPHEQRHDHLALRVPLSRCGMTRTTRVSSVSRK